MLYQLSEDRLGDLSQAARRGRAIASAARHAVEEADGFLKHGDSNIAAGAKGWLHDAEELIAELWDKFDFFERELTAVDREGSAKRDAAA